MLKHTLTAAALTIVLATPAFAQANRPDTMAKPDTAAQSSMPAQNTAKHGTFVQVQQATEWRGSS